MRFTSFLRSIIKKVPSSNTSSTSLNGKKSSVISEPSLSYSDSILVLSLILPSRQETCRFHVNLQTATVGQLINEIKVEDTGIEHIQIYDDKGNVLSSTCTMHALMHTPFTIQLNRKRTFLFDPINSLHIKEGTMRQTKADGQFTEDTVAALYYALNIMKVYHSKYYELQKEAEMLTKQLEPLEKVQHKLAEICQRYTSRCIWFGLGAMSFQVGVLAELTWDVYSWDIVEPISYFIAYGTVMIVYAYHLMTRSDFEYISWTDRLFLRKFYREAHRHAFDISMYNRIKDRLFTINTDLARLRSPLSLSLPVPPHSFKCKISGEEINPLEMYRTNRSTKQ